MNPTESDEFNKEKIEEIIKKHQERAEIRRDVILHMFHGCGIRTTDPERIREIMEMVNKKVDERLRYKAVRDEVIKELYIDKGWNAPSDNSYYECIRVSNEVDKRLRVMDEEKSNS